MTEFFSRTYYGNTVGEWLTTFLLILGAVVLGRAIYWAFTHAVRRLVLRSRSQVDDTLLDIVEEPVVLLLVVFGTAWSLDRLKIPGPFHSFLDGAFGMVYALVFAWLVTRVYDWVHKQYLVPLARSSSGAFDDQILPVLRKGIRLIIWTIALIVGLNNAGYNVGAVVAGLGIGGLAFALAAQDTVSNIFGGITIFAQKPFLIGDLIGFEDRQLTVLEIGWRATILQDWNTGHRVIIPNSKFTGGTIVNVSAEPGYWYDVTLKLAPDIRSGLLEQALRAIEAALAAHPDLTQYKVRFDALGNYSFDVLVLFHVRNFADRWRVISEANMAILQQLEALHVRLAAPMNVTVAPQAAAGQVAGALLPLPAPAQAASAATGVLMGEMTLENLRGQGGLAGAHEAPVSTPNGPGGDGTGELPPV